MSVLLPAGLPAGFTIEQATSAHVAEVFSLCAAEETAAFGFCPSTAEDVRSWLEQPATTMNLQHMVRDADGTPVQWWVMFRDAGDPITHGWICNHPDLPDAVSDELARAGWALMLNWVREHPIGAAAGETLVHSGCPAGPRPGHAGWTRAMRSLRSAAEVR